MEKKHLGKMETRYEKKLYSSIENYSQIISSISLNPLCFSEIFSERKINSLYFDDLEFTSYYDSIEGANLREKYRLRWYGKKKAQSECRLEIKSKQNDITFKKFFDIGFINLNKPIRRTLIFEVINKLKNKYDFDKCLMENYFPILYCSYKRRYFLSKNRKIRLTVDTDISYSNISFLKALSFTKTIKYPNIVLEIKYSNREDINNIFSNNFFDNQISRFSKYTNGIDLVYK